jgi:hypothetical protein
MVNISDVWVATLSLLAAQTTLVSPALASDVYAEARRRH